MSKLGYVLAGAVGLGVGVGVAYAADHFGKKEDLDACDCLCDGDCEDCEATDVEADAE